MKRSFVVIVLFMAYAWPLRAQELYLHGGVLKNTDRGSDSYSWQIEYLEGLGEHFAATLSYLNEGHFPNHHRDGNSLQLWARTNLLERRLSLAAGLGPYYYFDTFRSGDGHVAEDRHGWGGMFSMSATWYTESRWLFQLRGNWVQIDGDFNSLSAVAGLGYQFEAPPSRGPLLKTSPQPENTTNNEITLFAGQTIVNSFNSEHSVATAIEYRRGLWRYVDWTIGWLFEGDSRLLRRNGLTSQLWAVREFLDDRLALGVGGGAYLAIDHYPDIFGAGEPLSGILTFTGSYRLGPHWHLRTSWNRVVTNYNRDTDVILGGIGYRF
jgi:hypothetical protein